MRRVLQAGPRRSGRRERRLWPVPAAAAALRWRLLALWLTVQPNERAQAPHAHRWRVARAPLAPIAATGRPTVIIAPPPAIVVIVAVAHPAVHTCAEQGPMCSLCTGQTLGDVLTADAYATSV